MRWVTLFRNLANVMLVKDVGQIPLHLRESHGLDASLTGYHLEEDYPLLRGAAQKLPVTFINPGKQFKYLDTGVISYLFKEARNIDILNLYHFEPHTFFYGVLYKFLNPKGFLYIKLDNDLRTLESGNGLYPYGKPIAKTLFTPLENLFRKKTDLLTIETTKGHSLISKEYPDLAGKLAVIPNGVDTDIMRQDYDFSSVTPEIKENIIITVARLGTKQKNTSGFLEALTKVNLTGWKVYLVGPVEAEFEPYKKEFFEKYPHLGDTVIFTGNISERKELYSLYAKAKIFCLPSLWESFGIVILEALLFGCHVISTNFVSVGDLLPTDMTLGTIVPIGDIDALSNAITDTTKREIKQNDITNAQQYVLNNYDWKNITAELKAKIIPPQNDSTN
ncbi:MAG: glycosyltransferase family 4 protein [Candidatus Dojkabacteria bacterium]|nr:MAG: glycosyltransferase family 4 protein [Candidatus Dojkabacteria bacterium]